MAITFELKNTGTETLTLAPDATITLEYVPPPAPPEGTLAAALTAWNTAHASDNVPVGGAMSFVSGTSVSGGGSGRTFAEATGKNAIRQHGYINSFQYVVATKGGGNWKFKIMRPDGSGGFTLVGESQTFVPPGTGLQTLAVTTPIGPCQPGDVVGLYIASGEAVACSFDGGGAVAFASGDLSTLSTVNGSGYYLDITARGPKPFLVQMGDSHLCAHGNVLHRPFRDGGVSGDTDGEPASYLRAAFPDLIFQNWAKGSTTWADGASIISQVAAAGARAVHCHFGVNDVSAGRTWAQIEADMDTVKAGLPSGTQLFISEVLPWTSGNDTQAAAVRSLNANYATWCAANSATLIQCHDAMGQIRTSTGELDDLKTAYDDDGIHLHVPDGIEAFTDIDIAALDSYDWAS